MANEDTPHPPIDDRVKPVLDGILDGTIYPHDRRLIRDALDKREGNAPKTRDEVRSEGLGRALSGGATKRQW